MTTPEAVFKIGETVAAHWPTDHTLRTPFTVTARTAKFVTLRRVGSIEKVRVGVKVSPTDGEYALPFGRYSMAPIVRAGRAT